MSRLNGKDPDAGKDWREEEKGTTEDEMVGWHHQLDGQEFEQAPRDGKAQGRLQSMVSQRAGHDWVTEQQQKFEWFPIVILHLGIFTIFFFLSSFSYLIIKHL